jgi:hypothetical protein
MDLAFPSSAEAYRGGGAIQISYAFNPSTTSLELW